MPQICERLRAFAWEWAPGQSVILAIDFIKSNKKTAA